jgi:putative AdoMet-dependent methyltransferase
MAAIKQLDIELQADEFNAFAATRRSASRHDEMKRGGANHTSALYARAYDKRYQAFASCERQTRETLGFLGDDATRAVVDTGGGIGVFALHAARYYHGVGAAEVSRAMLQCARGRDRGVRLTNIALHRSDSPACGHEDEPIDAIVSVVTLHHPPDFWRLVGLRRLASMLNPDGRSCLLDIALSFDIGPYESAVRQLVRSAGRPVDARMCDESGAQLRDEYGTCHRLAGSLFAKAGFAVQAGHLKDELLVVYLCANGTAQRSSAAVTA